MENSKLWPVLTLQTTVLIWAATALFAKWIELPAEEIIYLRSFPALLAVLLATLWFAPRFELSLKAWGVGLILGVFMAGHWVSFYQAIQLSTVAVGLITLYTYPLLTAIIEPMLKKQPLSVRSIGLGTLGFIGVIFIASESRSGSVGLSAVLFGLLSAILFTARNLVSKYFAQDIPSIQQMLLQVIVTIFVLASLLGLEPVSRATGFQWQQLIVLGVFFVALPHSLFLVCLKHIDATQISLMSMIQPVYAIAMAGLFLSERPSLFEVIGGILILITATLAILEKRS